MDVFTHFAIPYLLLWGLGRPRLERIAAGIGGYAPDIDVLTAALAHFADPLYMLGHRGFSHTILGAPLHALALVLLLRVPLWARWNPRLAALRFGPGLTAVAMVASLTHLVLDAVTFWGVPLLWPFADSRVAIPWFFYSVMWALPPGAYLVWRVWRGTDRDGVVRVLGGLLVGILVVSGAAREAWRPEQPEGTVYHPGPFEWEWTTLEPRADGYAATFWSFGEPVGNTTYQAMPAATDAARAALEEAKESVAYRRFHLYAGGPVLESVEPAQGGWNVTFTDLLDAAQADRRGGWFGRDEAGRLELHVLDGRVRER